MRPDEIVDESEIQPALIRGSDEVSRREATRLRECNDGRVVDGDGNAEGVLQPEQDRAA